MHPLDGPHLLIERANEQLDAIQREVRQFREDNPQRVLMQYEPEHQSNVMRVYIHAPTPPRFGVLGGELVHTLRCVLDHLVWQLSLLKGPIPDDKEVLIEFPIFWKPPRDIAQITRHIDLCPDDAQKLVHAMQPYHASEWYGRRLLWSIASLDNIAKHRTVLVAGHQSRVSGYRIDGDAIESFQAIVGDLKDRDEVARFTPHADAQEQFRPYATLYVAIMEPGPAFQTAFLGTMYDLYEFVRLDVLPRFGGFFPKTADNPFYREWFD